MKLSLALLSSLLLLVGCYHLGAPGHEQFALDKLKIANASREPSLGRHLAAAIREHIGTDPSANLTKERLPKTDDATAPEKNIYDIAVNVKNYDSINLARARLRDKRSRDDDSDAYQTVLFRISITADIVVTQAGTNAPVLTRTYIGYGDLPLMHDRELPLQNACKQAANSIAMQLVDDLATLKP